MPRPHPFYTPPSPLRQNIKDKLHSLSLSQNVWKDFLGDIFGQQTGTHYEKGLVDSESAEVFNKAVAKIENQWNNFEIGCLGKNHKPQFHTWFCRHKVEDIIQCVLPNVRAKAGLYATSKFTTNNSESLNHVIKQEVEWQENKLPVLIDHLLNIVEQHENELQRAVICRGEWQFTSLYKHLEINEKVWFSEMTSSAKQKHMKKVLSCNLVTMASLSTSSSGGNCSLNMASLPTSSSVDSGASGNCSLSVTVESIPCCNMSCDMLTCIWKKAESLLANGHVIKIPWPKDERSRLVKSSSSICPHMVYFNAKNSKFICDEHCSMYKGFHICSHVVAVAEDNGQLKQFLESASAVLKPNLTNIANEGMPAGSGRKGGQPKRKHKCTPAVETTSTRPCLIASPTNDASTNTVPV